ncbi:MAG: hypothetical protein CFH38_01018, partial [Alphaproteobacteria bacterium MarineAlpha10_Bin1]
MVFLASGKTLAVSPRLNQRMENAPWIDETVGRYTDSTYYDQRTMVDALARVLRQNGLENARVGLNMDFARNISLNGDVSRDMERYEGINFFKT